MTFDWQQFLVRHGVDFAERGPSTSKGNLYIHCPFCGSADQGQHMGVSLTGKGWGCWRNQTHRGKDPARLIQALLGVNWTEAVRLAGRAAGGLPGGLGGFMDAVNGALSGPRADVLARPLAKPKEFKPLVPHGQGQIFYSYMADRGFSQEQTDRLARTHKLHYAMSGDWSYRLIIPVRDRATEWVTWTGRAIHDSAKIRYKTLTADPDKVGDGEPLAHGPITNYLLDLPNLFKGGKLLIVAEGPFDALRLALFARPYDYRATCLFGKAISYAQQELLLELRPLYERIVLVLDPDAAMDALSLSTRLAAVGVIAQFLDGDNDPGEMSAAEIKGLFASFAKYKSRD